MIVLYVVLGLIALVLVLAALRPSDFRYVRTRRLDGVAAAKVFPFIVDFHRWSEFSPWEALDPQMTRTYDGAPSGVGAKYAWKGNKKVGEGSMAITAVEPDRKVVIDLHFLKPFEARNVTEVTLTADGGATTVEWAMSGKNLFIAKVFGLFFNMEKLIGKDFEKGLAKLEEVARR